MDNKEEKTSTPKRHGPPGTGVVEKPKDFKTSIKRIFKELGAFKIGIGVAIILAIASAILTIISPDKLSDLTDEITNGITVDSKNIKTLTTKITNNFSEEKIESRITDVLAINLNKDTINKIMTNANISEEDKNNFNSYLSNPKDVEKLTTLNPIIINEILPTTKYKNIKITTNDKLELLEELPNIKQGKISLPDSIKKVLLDEIEVNNIKISSYDQLTYLEGLSSINMKKMNKSESTKFYKMIDKMPKSIKKVIEPKMDLTKIKELALLIFILYLLSSIFGFFEQIIMAFISNKFAYKLRNTISMKINKLPLKFFDTHTTGDTMSRVTNDVDTLAQSLNHSLATLITSLTLLFGTVFMMFKTNWIMSLTAIVSSLFGFVFLALILLKSQKYFVKRQKELGNLNGHIEEIYSGLSIVKTYNGKSYANEKFDKYNKSVYDANIMSQFLSGLMPPMMGFIGNLGYVMVCIVGALLTMNGIITFGVIVAFMAYVRLFTTPLNQIAQSLNALQSAAAAGERIFEFADEEEMTNEDGEEVLKKEEAKGNIEFKNVVFTYPGNDKATIKGFSAKAKSGEKIAIVGPTGAGKTTLVNLLMKFYEIDSGDILIDGKSTKNLKRENIHDLFTMVLQDTWLFEGTIEENIKYNRENIERRDVERVCEIVGLDHYIKTLPNTYDSKISNNDSVSAGERQLLTIARGMLKASPFLILDEATSNVDTRTEELVQEAMDKLTEGKTSFIIAHRLSTIKNADLILVMNNGNIIEQGNHEELMKKKGFYADLYNSQFEL